MGCSASLPSGNPVDERENSIPSAPPTHTNGVINMGSSSSLPSGKPTNERASSQLSPTPTNTNDVINMGSSSSLSSGKPTNKRTSSQLSPTPTDTNGPVDGKESSLLSLQEPTDDENSSNLSADQKAGQKQTENQANSPALKKVEDDLGWLEEETNEEIELTDEEILSRKDSLFRFLNKAINNIHTILSSANEDEKLTKVLWKHFVLISDFIFTVQKIGPLPVEVLNKYRREAGQQLSTTQSVPVICKVVTKGWQKCAKQPGSTAVELPSLVTLAAMSVLWNFSDCSPEVTIDITEEYTFLNTLQEILTCYLQERIQGEEMVNCPYEEHVKVNRYAESKIYTQNYSMGELSVLLEETNMIF